MLPDKPALSEPPEPRNTEPEFPLKLVPELRINEPVTPAALELEDRTYTAPDDVAVGEPAADSTITIPPRTSPTPERKTAAPPVCPEAVVSPPSTTTGAPFAAFVAPARREMDPAGPPFESDVPIRINPDDPAAAWPVSTDTEPEEPLIGVLDVRMVMDPLEEDH
jgi:hypothetical protein